MGMSNKKKLVFQFVKFAVVGVANTLVTFVVFWLLNRWFGWEMAAHVIGYVVGTITSYFSNKYWTFKAQGGNPLREGILFAIVNLVSLLVSTLVLKLCLRYLGITDEWIVAWCPVFLQKVINKASVCEILSMPSAFIVNFIGSKLLVFREKESK